LLSFGSAMLQATVAVIAITALVLLLRGLGLKQGTLTLYLEIASYAAVTALGLWLFGRKLMTLFAGRTPSSTHDHACNGDHDHGVCPSCGHAHMPAPEQIGGKNFTTREGWSAILAVGLRPCSGALIVLTFAFLNGLYAAGIASAYAMAIGTGITVAIIATVAVMAKNTAFRVLGITSAGAVYYNAVELIGAGLILMIGFTLLMASLA
jgi:nickel/cobalt exporter